MADNLQHIYSALEIERYLQGNMSAAEMHALEKAALNDPLLADAIEGYEQANTQTTHKHLNNIAAKLQSLHTEGRVMPLNANNRFNWRKYTAAAAIVGVLGLGGWLASKTLQKEDMAIAIVSNTPKKTSSAALDSMLTNNKEIIETSPQTPKTIVAPNGQNNIASYKKTQKEIFHTTPLSSTAKEAPVDIGQHAEVFTREVYTNSETTTVAKNTQPTASQQYDQLQDINAPRMGNKIEAAPTMFRIRGISNANNKNTVVSGFQGKVIDDKGNPISNASLLFSNMGTATNADGSFFLPPVSDTALYATISAVGYEPKTERLQKGYITSITMQPAKQNLNEVVVVGYGTRKKASTSSISKLKIDTLQSKKTPYPTGGWRKLYSKLNEELNIDAASADKVLHIKFDIERGRPVKFTVVAAPDSSKVRTVISVLKNGPDWNTKEGSKSAEVKIKVD